MKFSWVGWLSSVIAALLLIWMLIGIGWVVVNVHFGIWGIIILETVVLAIGIGTVAYFAAEKDARKFLK